MNAHLDTCCSQRNISHLNLCSLQYKAKANAAFKEKNWDEAIYNYSKSLEHVQSHVNYSNRSAAYLKTGDYERALADANMCIKLKKDYNKGYLRKGNAYHSMQVSWNVRSCRTGPSKSEEFLSRHELMVSPIFVPLHL